MAYTVSGNQMTMTGNVASTDDFYVVYIGRVVGTVNHPANAPLSATTGTFSDDLTVGTNTLHVDAANGNVGIGTTTPDNNSGYNALTISDTTGGQIYWKSTSHSVTGYAGQTVMVRILLPSLAVR